LKIPQPPPPLSTGLQHYSIQLIPLQDDERLGNTHIHVPNALSDIV
jgi:hypothetical protein